MNKCKEADFISNSVALKCTCSYQSSNHSDHLFIKDEFGNTVEDWGLYVQKQDNYDGISLCLIARNKYGENITQIDFDDVPKATMAEFIKDLVEVYKYKFHKETK